MSGRVLQLLLLILLSLLLQKIAGLRLYENDENLEKYRMFCVRNGPSGITRFKNILMTITPITIMILLLNASLGIVNRVAIIHSIFHLIFYWEPTFRLICSNNAHIGSSGSNKKIPRPKTPQKSWFAIEIKFKQLLLLLKFLLRKREKF